MLKSVIYMPLRVQLFTMLLIRKQEVTYIFNLSLPTNEFLTEPIDIWYTKIPIPTFKINLVLMFNSQVLLFFKNDNINRHIKKYCIRYFTKFTIRMRKTMDFAFRFAQPDPDEP